MGTSLCSQVGSPERPLPTGALPLPLRRWQASLRLAICSLPPDPRANARPALPWWKCPDRTQQWPRSGPEPPLASAPHRRQEAYSAVCSHRMGREQKQWRLEGSGDPMRCHHHPRSLAVYQSSAYRIRAPEAPRSTLQVQPRAWACSPSGQCPPLTAIVGRWQPHPLLRRLPQYTLQLGALQSCVI